MKTLILYSFIFLISYNAYSQDITNTLGTGGLFTIKDASNNYLTLSQSTGQVNILRSLRLELTGNSSTTGVIFKGASRFIHDFKPSGALGYNTFLGINAGNFSMSGTGDQSSYNTGIGHSSLFSNTSGQRNTAVGNYSLYTNTTGNYNTALGYQALYLNYSGNENTAVGCYSLRHNTTGYCVTAVGYQSLWSNTTGHRNIAVGNYSLRLNTTGCNNTALGYYSLYHNTTGDSNTAVGSFSLRSNSTGYHNTAIGYYAGFNITTGHNNTLIGYNSQPSSGTVNSEITLGNNGITSLRCNVTTITSLSDARDKKNINDLSLGLNFITQLKPRQFNWDKREWYKDNKSDGSKMDEKLTAGFIAQEFDEVQQSENAKWLDLVYKSNPEKLETTTGNLLPVMVKAIQELNDKNESLEKEIAQLKNEIESFKSVNENLVKLEKMIMEMKANENEIKEIKSSSN